jgi:adenylate cyclase
VAIDFEAEGLLEGLEDERARRGRLELLRRLSEDGVQLEELKRAAAEGRLALLPVDRVIAGGGPSYTAMELAEAVGLDPPALLRARRATGLPVPDPVDRALNDHDLETARNGKALLDAGIPEEEFLELTRVMGRSVAGVAAAMTRTFGESFIEPGDTELDAAFRYAEVTRRLLPLAGPTLEHMLALHLCEQLRSAVLGQAELAEGRLPGAQPVTVCFADLVGFTRLGERLEADELGAVAGRLERAASEVAVAPVRLVKTIGDAAMLVSADPDPLLDAALELVETAEAEGEGLPRLRAGVAHGDALARAGDWYGRPVNLASRITGFARAGSVVASKEVRQRAAEDAYSWSFAGRRRFKGLSGEVTLFRVRRPEPG